MSSIVAADAGPLHYLILIEGAEILADLFDRVLIPATVRDELLHASTPQKVKDWMSGSRNWLQVEQVLNPQPNAGLHRGEAEALQLALQINAAGVLMDDMDGRAEARRLGLVVIGYNRTAGTRGGEKLDRPARCIRQTPADKFFCR